MSNELLCHLKPGDMVETRTLGPLGEPYTMYLVTAVGEKVIHLGGIRNGAGSYIQDTDWVLENMRHPPGWQRPYPEYPDPIRVGDELQTQYSCIVDGHWFTKGEIFIVTVVQDQSHFNLRNKRFPGMNLKVSGEQMLACFKCAKGGNKRPEWIPVAELQQLLEEIENIKSRIQTIIDHEKSH